MSNAAAPATEGPDRTDGPLHVAIIMDGNGRWAAARGLPRAEGHRRGVDALRRVVRAAGELGILYLTIFSFSSENWSRPATEIGDLFGLLRRFIRNDLATLHRDGVRVRVIGERDGLELDICALLNEAEELTKGNTKLNLVVALVLAPLAIAIAYAGGWLWATLVTCAACGLYVEWLMIIDAARQTRVVASGVVALAIAGFCLASGWIDAALLVLVLGLAAVALLSPERRLWTATGFFYAAAAEIASVLVRLDQIYGFAALILILLVVWVTDIGGYFLGRGICGPKHMTPGGPQKNPAGAPRGLFATLLVVVGGAALGGG